jgi:ABC-type uncharacterized transport system ATPase subunit
VPAVVNWRQERARLAAFMDTVPFKVPLEKPVSQLAAGEKQKTGDPQAALPQARFMILDEPTSVLTPSEADEVLGMLRDMTRANKVTILMITHKFREVMAFADAVTVLGAASCRAEGQGRRPQPTRMAEMMVGSRDIPQANGTASPERAATEEPRLSVRKLYVDDDTGLPRWRIFRIDVRPGEIVGIAGVSGNGQRELVEALVGQREAASPAKSASAASPTPLRAAKPPAPGCSACRRSRCATPACRS